MTSRNDPPPTLADPCQDHPTRENTSFMTITRAYCPRCKREYDSVRVHGGKLYMLPVTLPSGCVRNDGGPFGIECDCGGTCDFEGINAWAYTPVLHRFGTADWEARQRAATCQPA